MYALDEWSTNAPSHQFVVYRFHLKGKTVRSRCERGYALWRLFQKETLTRVSSPLTVGISYSSVIIVAHAQFMIRKCEKSRYKVNENIGRTHSRMLDIVCTVYIYSAHSVFHIQCTFYLYLASQYTCGLFIVIHHEGIHNIKPSARKKKQQIFATSCLDYPIQAIKYSITSHNGIHRDFFFARPFSSGNLNLNGWHRMARQHKMSNIKECDVCALSTQCETKYPSVVGP